MLHSGCQHWQTLGFLKVNFSKAVDVWRVCLGEKRVWYAVGSSANGSIVVGCREIF